MECVRPQTHHDDAPVSETNLHGHITCVMNPYPGAENPPPTSRQSLRASTVFSAVSAYPLPCQGAASGAQLHPDRRHLRHLPPPASLP